MQRWYAAAVDPLFMVQKWSSTTDRKISVGFAGAGCVAVQRRFRDTEICTCHTSGAAVVNMVARQGNMKDMFARIKNHAATAASTFAAFSTPAYAVSGYDWVRSSPWRSM